MKTWIKVAAIAIAVVALVGCKQTPKHNLTDGEWVLHAWTSDSGEEMVMTTNRPTMNFTDSARVHGFGGCNNYMGRYEVNGENIKIDMGGMTMKMCMDMEAEQRMVTQIPNVTRFKIDGDQLMLFAGEKELFRFDNSVVNENVNNQ